MKPLTILNISQNLHVVGGSDRYFLNLTELLTSRGHRVIPFVAADPRNKPSEWSSNFPHGANFDRPGPHDLIRYVYSGEARHNLQVLINSVQPDIVHLHIYYGKLTASIFEPIQRAGIPIVQTLHEYKLVCPVYTMISGDHFCDACRGNHFWQALPRRCKGNSLPRTMLSVAESYVSRALGALDAVDHFITVSESMKQLLLKYLDVGDRLTAIYNFLPLAAPQSMAPSEIDGDYLLFFGRLERLKGLLTLIEAAAPLNIPLIIAGAGSVTQEIAEAIRERRLTHIQLIGFQEGEVLARLIANSLCTIVPSEWYEPFGYTVLESYQQRRPVIASQIGALPELISHGETGLLFKPGDVQALRGAIEWMINHPDSAAQMGAAGYEQLISRFGAEDHYEKLMTVYQKVLG